MKRDLSFNLSKIPTRRLVHRPTEPAQTVAFHPTVVQLDLDQAAAHLGLSVDDFNYYRLVRRIPAPLNGKFWLASTLKLSYRAPDSERISGIYVIGFLDFIKIGFSDCLYHRLSGLQTGLPLRMKIHQVIEGPGRQHEKHLHRRFSEYRTVGEWFRHEGRLADWIEGGCK